MLSINIQTENLTLRNLTTRDVSQDYADWLNDPEISKYLSSANNLQTIETCLDYVKSFELKNDVVLLGIFLKDDNLHIGNVTLMPPIDWQNKKGWVGISVGRKNYSGKGFAEEALSATVNYCFKNLNLHRLQAGVATINIRSVNLFVKCGFKIEGLLRDSGVIDGNFEDCYVLGIINDFHDKGNICTR